MIYCAIIGDIVKSRKMHNRQETQDKFKKAINEINEQYSNYIASKFTVTLGDEFQGLLHTPYISYSIIRNIKIKMSPIGLVFGVGIGKMDTYFDKDISIGSDGPAYHYARKMVQRAKKKKPTVCYYSNSIEDEIINSLIYFIESCEKNRTKKQMEVVELYKQYRSQVEVANHLNVEQSSISRILNNAFYSEIINAEEQLVEFLKNKYSKNNAL